jgi:hypothetical protein
MELIEKLMLQDTAKNNSDFRMFKAIKVGKYYMSVQGSTGHYCSPRTTVSPDVYSRMELAIINKHESMVSINRSVLLRKFKRYDELVSRADSLNSNATVYGYVSVDLLNDLYLYLKNQ